MDDINSSDDELLEEIERLSGVVDRLRDEEQSIILRNRNLNLLTAISGAVNQSLELQEVVNTAVEVTVDAFGVEAGLISLYDPASKTYLPAGYRGVSDRIIEAMTVLEAGEGLVSKIGEAGRPVIVDDLEKYDNIELPEALHEGLPSLAGFTIKSDSDLLGVMVLLSSEPDRIGPENEDFFFDIGDQIGRAIAKARLYRHSKNQIVENMMGDRQRTKFLKQAQERVKNLDTMIDALGCGLLLLDESQRIMLANAQAENEFADLIGIEEGEVLPGIGGIDFSSLCQPAPEQPYHSVEYNGAAYQIQAISLSDEDNPNRGWVIEIREAHCAPTTGPAENEGQLTAEMVVSSITQYLDRSLGVIGLLAGMSSIADLPKKHLDRLHRICEETRRAESLNRELMDYTRQTVYSLRPLSLFDLIQELIEELGLATPENINIEFVHSGEDFPVTGNPEALRTVFMNLTKNALHAMTDGGQLRIALRQINASTLPELRWPGVEAGDCLQLTVTDTGRGIPGNVLPLIFDPFFSTSDVADAHGMGLSQALGIVTQHGGRLDVISEVGNGTTCAVHLPMIIVEPTAPPNTSAIPRAGSSEQLVVVVRNEIVCSGLVDTLSDLGYCVCAASTTEEALEIIEEHEGHEHSVIFEATGEEIAQHRSQLLEGLDPDTPVILISSASMDDASAKALGWNGWIQSPPQLTRLADAVARAFRR